MNDTQKSELMMLIRVDQFGEDHPLLPVIAKATLHYGTVASAKDQILAMSGLKVLGTGEFRAAAADRQFVVADLRVKLREIAVTANATIKSVAFNNAGSSAATLTVNVGVVLTVTTTSRVRCHRCSWCSQFWA